MDAVALADGRHLRQIGREVAHLALYLTEEVRGVRRRVEDEHACGGIRGALEAVHGPTRNVDELARPKDELAAVDREPDVALEDVIRLVPRMMVGRRPYVPRRGAFGQ